MLKLLIFKRLYLSSLLVLCALCTASAQDLRLEVLSTTGQSFAKDNYQLEYTLGETVSETQGNRFYFATQGFHQIEWTAVVIWENEQEQIDISLFPNPYSRLLTVKLPEVSTQDIYGYHVYDLTFKDIASGELTAGENPLELGQLAPGTYLMNITKNQELIETHRIIKIH